MRWESLRTTAAGTAALPLELPETAPQGTGRAGLAVAGPAPVTGGDDEPVAIEIRAKSIINRVPAASHMPFDWTINPYRGCSHACVYCLAGDTPILMADGHTKPLAEVREGDRVYGTERAEGRRRYTVTEVLAHWRTVKPAYEVELADGTTIVASGDHRFLTERGWKHVTGSGPEGGRRAHLTTVNELFGVGQLPPPPVQTRDYRHGYLAASLRGGGRSAPGAALELGPLARTRQYLDELRYTAESDRQAAVGAPAWVSRAVEETAYSGPEELVTPVSVPTPGHGSDEWCKGFLAGIFDAEGSFAGGTLRIGVNDPDVVAHVTSSLARFGFRYAVDLGAQADGIRYAWVSGGLREGVRFLHTVDPASAAKRSLLGLPVGGGPGLRVVAVRSTGLELPMYDITTGTGDFVANGVVSHNCFARNTHTYLDLDAGNDFNTKIVVKVNAGELARRELASPRWRGESIAMGTNTDPYQRAEGRYRLMRQIIAALRDHANPFSILTKGTLILRDLDLLTEAAKVTRVSVAVSVGSTDDQLWRSVEPGTPSPARRLDVVRRFADAGIGCSVLMAPVLPGLSDSDEQIDTTVRAIAAAGASSVTPLALHLRPGAREWYRGWLGREHPHLAPMYDGMYRNGSYAPKAYQRSLTARVRAAAERHGLTKDRPGAFRRVEPREDPPEPPARQPSLFS
ncbi:MAG TPA: intein-containing Rv2578c family radical SAM protein [Streptosporangiales bacterium]